MTFFQIGWIAGSYNLAEFSDTLLLRATEQHSYVLYNHHHKGALRLACLLVSKSNRSRRVHEGGAVVVRVSILIRFDHEGRQSLPESGPDFDSDR